MTKKERLGSDPFKESSLDWIQDTREKKKDSKEPKKQETKESNLPDLPDVKASKRQDAKTLKRQSVLTSKRFDVKTSRQNKIAEEPEPKRKHTIYLSISQSRKLKVYAAEKNIQLSEVIEKLIKENL